MGIHSQRREWGRGGTQHLGHLGTLTHTWKPELLNT